MAFLKDFPMLGIFGRIGGKAMISVVAETANE